MDALNAAVVVSLPDLLDIPEDDHPLLERAAELEALEDAVTRVAAGRGGVAVLEAGAGLGKTALLDHTAELARDAGCEVRRVVPSPLERHFRYGVVRALLEAPLRDASVRERTRLLQGAAEDAGRLLLGGRAPEHDATTMVAHSVFWLCSALASTRPLVLVVDDAQWADRPSLEVLTYLARRASELPVLILVAARAGDPGAPSDLLSLLEGVPDTTVLRPAPLTVWGAATLIRRHAPHVSLRVCRECHRAVGGSPWLLGELGRQVAVFGPAATSASGRNAPPVTTVARDVVRRRLAALTPRDRGVAAALAVLGHGAPLHVVAALAGIELGELAPVRDALRAAGLLAPDRTRLAHGLIATAVLDDLPGTERERLHREAARLLNACGASIAAIASHLLDSGPHGDPEVSALLVRAAQDAADRGAPAEAAAYLERALAERARGDDRGAMLAALGSAAFDAGRPDARRRLHDALREQTDPERRRDVLTRLAAFDVLAGPDDALPDLLRDEPESHPALDVAGLDALVVRPERRHERVRRLSALPAPEDPALIRSLAAHRAWAATELGAARAEACAALALEALEDGVLLRDAARRAGYHLATGVLILTDRHSAAGEAIDALRDQADERGSRPLRAAAAWFASELALRRGDLMAAELEARTALDEPISSAGALSVLVRALTERGQLGEAAGLLDGGRYAQDVSVRGARARLWLAGGDYQRAHAEATEVGALRMRHGRPNPVWSSWRSTAALALAHLGRREEAAVLAAEDVVRAERFGAATPLVAALHARAVAESDDAARIALCRRALELPGTPLDAVRVRLVLGATLSRLGDRVEAREELRPALAAADAAGARPLAERARRELVATGLRPRQAAIEGEAALTPRQREICALAAAGKGNREIANALFLSIKTVETHLAAGYRKLGINSRAEIGAALAGATE